MLAHLSCGFKYHLFHTLLFIALAMEHQTFKIVAIWSVVALAAAQVVSSARPTPPVLPKHITVRIRERAYGLAVYPLLALEVVEGSNPRELLTGRTQPG